MAIKSVINYVGFFVFLAGCLGLLWLLVEPIVRWTEYSEIRLCVRLFLFMFAVSTFATLRLYNSIVQNTRFSIKLREALLKFTQVVPGLERSMKNLNSSLGNLKSSVDSTKKSVDNNAEKTDKLSEKLSKVK